MLTLDRLWQRSGGDPHWHLAWAVAAAAVLPWLLPEAWDGQVPAALQGLGWALVAATLPLLGGRCRAGAFAVLAAWGALGGLAAQARAERRLPLGTLRVAGTVAAPWHLRGRARCGRVLLTAPAAVAGLELPLSLPAGGAPAPDPGTPVAFLADLKAVRPAPPFLAERPLWKARNAGRPRRAHLASALALRALGPPRPGPLLRLRCAAQRRFLALPLGQGPARDLWGALTLGIPPRDPEAFAAFARSGTLHVLVVSGLQVTLAMAALEGLGRRLPGLAGAGLALAGGALYAALVGPGAPVWRGWLMGAAWVAGRATGWRLPAVLTLHAALLLWVLVHPGAGCEPGFLLGWFALLGLRWGAEPLAGLLSPLPGSTLLAGVLAPWLTTLPLLALFHGGAPLLGPLANLVLLPLVAVLGPLCLGLTVLPVPGLVPLAGAVLAWAGGVLVPALARVAPLATGVLWPWLALLSGWLLLARLHTAFRRTRALTLALAAASLGLVALGGTGRGAASLSLEAIDVGQGDALLLRVPGAEATLVDCGPDPAAARRVVRVLARRGVREPVHLVLSHPHLDHAGGAEALAALWPLASVALPVLPEGPAAWRAFLAPAAAAAARPLRRGDHWQRGDAAFSVRWPPGPLTLPDLNMVSAVLRVRWRDRELWLMGDALALQERDLVALGEPGPGAWRRLLKAGHHGSRGASDGAWLAALAPDLALVPAGAENPFGHPHREAMARLRGACGAVHVVGPCAGVRVEAAGPGWRVWTGQAEGSTESTGITQR